MSPKKLVWPAVFVLLALIVGFLAGNFFSGKSLARRLFLNTNNKIDVLLDIINEEYVDSIDMKNLTENAIAKIVDELDPHSNYIPADVLESINENMDGRFAGIGINYIFHSDTMVINSILPGGPAEQAGLLAGDRIITINDSTVAGSHFSEDKMLEILHGKVGTLVKLSIVREGTDSPREYTITRAYVPLNSIKAAFEITAGIGIIKIYDTFTNTTYDEFIGAMAKLLNKGCQSFIIDLRMNKGGSFDAAIHICNEFLPRGRTIVYMEGKSFPREYVTANGLGTLQDKQIVILMDQISASASEIVAGAIQDNDRGLVIGRRSFGKGLVQNQIELSDGSAVRLTIARYYTPSGRNIQRKYEMGKTDEYNQEWFDRLSAGEGLYQDSVILNTSHSYYTLNGRKVYGGGGIMPDIFVPLDTTELTSYYLQLENKGIFYQFAFEYSDANRSQLKTFTNSEDMLLYLKKEVSLFDVVRFAETKGIKRRTSLINISADQIMNMTYAHILQNFFGEEAYFSMILNNDPLVQRAVEEIQKGNDSPEAVANMKYKEH
ncbi:MAG: S41 family peptidase [Candidatus Azobacteroides sp.]|nr:S41 family peptidase [Candidatus Azobacteroides sp.]